ncbi:MAG: hypothetical protein GC159_11280 [Phycisphaera sp.]|nr:hypothetical protein [Phycisphaera sp.]
MAQTSITDTPADFWWGTLTSPLSILCLVLMLVSLVAAAVLLRAAVRVGKRRASGDSLAADTGGTATIEFALLMPILLFVILLLAQVTFLMAGNIFVHYSAFAAARAAIVQVPTEYPDSPANEYDNTPGSTKRDAIWRAAVFALVPASGDVGGGNPNGDISTSGFVSGLNEFYSAYGQPAPPWITAKMENRLAYAAEFTDIALFRPVAEEGSEVTFEPMDGGKFDPKDPIRVVVYHRLNLPVPYVNQIFADGTHVDGRSRYMNVAAHATLTNEGVLDKMPPEPDVPRLP